MDPERAVLVGEAPRLPPDRLGARGQLPRQARRHLGLFGALPRHGGPLEVVPGPDPLLRAGIHPARLACTSAEASGVSPAEYERSVCGVMCRMPGRDTVCA